MTENKRFTIEFDGHQYCKEYNSKVYSNHTKTCRRLVKQISELEKENGDFEMIEWKRQVSRVYADGQSYNCSNKVTAKTLQHTLNTYEKRIQSLKKQIQYNNNHDEIKKQLNTLSQHTITIQKDIQQIKELLE